MAPVTMSFDASNHYYAAQFATRPFAGGDTIEITATGGVVDGFSGSIVAPSDITLTAPVATGTPPSYPVSSDSDLVLSWTGGSAGALVAVDIFPASSSSTHYQRVLCTFDAAGGTGTIPASVLSHFTDYDSISVAPLANINIASDDAETTYVVTGTSIDGPISPP